MSEPSHTTATAQRPARLTMRVVWAMTQDELFNLHRGLPGTWLALWWRPGATIRRYVEWRDKAITPPLRYLIVSLALSAVLLQVFGMATTFQSSMGLGVQEAGASAAGGKAFARGFAQHLELWLILTAMPAMALALRRVYAAHINLAEALAFACYVLAQVCLGFVLLAVLDTRMPGHGLDLILTALLVLWPLYFTWASHGYFRPSGRGVGRALVATIWVVFLVGLFALALTFVGLMLTTK